MNTRIMLGACVLTFAGSAHALPVFLVTDGTTLYRGDTAGNLEVYNDFLGTGEAVTALAVSFDGSHVIAVTVEDQNRIASFYRIDNAFDPNNAPLNAGLLGTSNGRPTSIDFDDAGNLYGVIAGGPSGGPRITQLNTAGGPGGYDEIPGTSIFAGLNPAQFGSGGLQVSGDGTRFIIHTPTLDLLAEVDTQGTASTADDTTTILNTLPFDYGNNGLDSIGDTLWVSYANFDTGNIEIGSYNSALDTFTAQVIIEGAGAAQQGFVVRDVIGGIPTPGTLALVGFAGLAAARRRRA